MATLADQLLADLEDDEDDVDDELQLSAEPQPKVGFNWVRFINLFLTVKSQF